MGSHSSSSSSSSSSSGGFVAYMTGGVVADPGDYPFIARMSLMDPNQGSARDRDCYPKKFLSPRPSPGIL